MAMITGTWQDREQIRELYARYSLTIDAGQFDGWLNCFTDDGVFESGRFGRHAGREGLRRFTAIYQESLGGAQVRHLNPNVSFTIDGDRATGVCYLAYYHIKGGKVELSAVGMYRDTLRKVGEEWRFESRKVSVDNRP